ncbi:hypothetical protein F5Y09DRAFT_312075 [Xylaria sp. FL1042]|nr:hypothetical protein F5Y09DRAFT_312075 [Xylaria sp. FL1042]
MFSFLSFANHGLASFYLATRSFGVYLGETEKRDNGLLNLYSKHTCPYITTTVCSKDTTTNQIDTQAHSSSSESNIAGRLLHHWIPESPV